MKPMTTSGRRRLSFPYTNSLIYCQFDLILSFSKWNTYQIINEWYENQSHSADIATGSNTNPSHLGRIQFTGKWINDQKWCRNHCFWYQKNYQRFQNCVIRYQHSYYTEYSTVQRDGRLKDFIGLINFSTSIVINTLETNRDSKYHQKYLSIWFQCLNFHMKSK